MIKDRIGCCFICGLRWRDFWGSAETISSRGHTGGVEEGRCCIHTVRVTTNGTCESFSLRQ